MAAGVFSSASIQARCSPTQAIAERSDARVGMLSRTDESRGSMRSRKPLALCDRVTIRRCVRPALLKRTSEIIAVDQMKFELAGVDL